MATLELVFPGASAGELLRGLTAAGDVIRNSRFSLEHLHAAWLWKRANESAECNDWRTHALQLWQEAEGAAFAACSPKPPPPQAMLTFAVSLPPEYF